VGDVVECGAAMLVLRDGDDTAVGGRNPLLPTGAGHPLLVGAEARWFESVAGSRIELGRRGALRRLLAALTQKRIDEPGRGLSVLELFALGWPEEKAD